VADLHFKYTGDHTFIYAGVLIGWNECLRFLYILLKFGLNFAYALNDLFSLYYAYTLFGIRKRHGIRA
jgi:hypothetical protein